MRQLLLRVSDDLHARLTARAKRENVSVNALANTVLDAAAPPPPPPGTDVDGRRHEIRERARELGILVETHAPPVSPQRFTAALRHAQDSGSAPDAPHTDGR